MKIIDQSVRVLYPGTLEEGINELKKIEIAGRNCWRSEGKITDDSYKSFVQGLIKRGHDSPLEFGEIMFEIITSRDVLAEITRHRIASFAVESQRYVNESREDGGIKFIKPLFFKQYDPYYESGFVVGVPSEHSMFLTFKKPDRSALDNKGDGSEYYRTYDASRKWEETMLYIEDVYNNLIEMGMKNQDARKVLPNSTACTIMMKVNLRELLHMYKLRSSPAAYPEMQEMMRLLKIEVDKVLPGFLPEKESV